MSEYIEIVGGSALNGEVVVSGAKNAALPLLLASLLTSEQCTFSRVPNLEDVSLVGSLLEHFGGVVERNQDRMSVQVATLIATDASYSLVKALRASFWVLGPLLARGRAARVALPGGDIIGARPVDMHIAALEKMGAQITVKHGVVLASAVGGLKPAVIDLRSPSVGATHQIIMAAALTPGTTVINNAAREPEVEALAQMINQMGGDVEGAGSSKIVIHGRDELGGCDVSIIGDRIEAATYILGALATGGSVKAIGINPQHFGSFPEILNNMGVELSQEANSMTVRSKGRLLPVNVATGPFPGFATDIQAPLMAALCVADGVSYIEENIFEGRFGHASELCRMGAQISIEERTAKIIGVPKLTGAPVDALDIRAAAALVIAALSAEGTTLIGEPHHIRRGYDSLEAKLRKLGARIGSRMHDPEDYVFSGC